MKERVLVTGSYGQIGTELVMKLRNLYGNENVIATDIMPSPEIIEETGPSAYLDVTDNKQVTAKIIENKITIIYHLAAILSGNGELNPQKCYNVNMNGLYNILEAARLNRVRQVITPSSIAAFGPDTPKENTPIDTLLRPTTMYGITKVAGELLNEYYNHKYGLDVRSLRYPGIISSEAEPGGGTTDYSVEMFVKAAAGEPYQCFVTADTTLPFMYMPDALRSIIQLAEAPEGNLKHRTFNVVGFSCSAGQIEAEIKKTIPDFQCTYVPDFRQLIAESWPRSIDDSAARMEWNWRPEYKLPDMAVDMLNHLKRV